VESNFKVFVYTASKLQISVVSQLCELRSLTPCLVVGALTRDSVQQAYRTGITAAQVIRFLETHCHPLVYRKHLYEGKRLLPDNVETQLRMWEAERSRLIISKCCVLEFNKENDVDLFCRCVNWANQRGALLMHSPYPQAPGVPATNSPEYQNWLNQILEKLRSSASSGTKAEPMGPVLAAPLENKQDLTDFVKSLSTKQT